MTATPRKISEMPPATVIADADLLPIVDVSESAISSKNKKVTVAQILASLPDGAITSAKIADGAIVDADINAAANIADAKLATIATAGKVSNSATTATNANTASAIVARDGSGNFSAGTITAALAGNALTVTTNANLTGDVTSVGNATSIAAGVVVNADVNASAAIVASKLSFTQAGTGAVARTVDSKLKDVVSVKDFGAVGDYNPSTNSGTNDSTAFNQATQVASTVYVPEGAYLISTFPNLTTFLSKGWFGAGDIYYDNGSSTEQIGKITRAGVNDPNGNLGALTQGGLLIGGEGPGSNGVLLYGQHPGWVQFQSTSPGNPTEVQVYSSAIIGIASSVSGTAFIDATYADFSSSRLQVDDIITFGRTEYRIKTKTSSTRLELKTVAGAAVTFASSYSETFRHCYIYADGFCNTSGTGVTWKSGDYFFDVYNPYSEKKIIVGSTTYSVSSVSNNLSLTLSSSAGTQSNAAFTLKIYSIYVSLLRLQSLAGGSEEAVALYIGSAGDIFLETQFAGFGKYRPLRFRTGPDYDYGYYRDHFGISADGRIGFGKDYVETGFPTSAKVHIWRDGTTAQATDGTTDLRVLTLDSTHAGISPRQLAFGFHNNFNAGYIQGFVNAAGTTAGPIHIQPFGGSLRVGGGTTSFTPNILSVGGNISATVDNIHSCGTATHRWTEIFAASSTINTSDEREKEQGRALSEAEQAVAVKIKGLLKVFKFTDAVARKGDKARIHFGVYAQEIATAFEAEGLNASDYALFCYDEWDDVHDEQGTKVQDAGNRYGIRYGELLAFVLAAL